MAVKGVQGNMAAQSRIMGHDAVVVDFGVTIAGTESRGAALYVGIAVSVLTVVMESGNEATFYNVPAGTFMPILVTQVRVATGATTSQDILAIY